MAGPSLGRYRIVRQLGLGRHGRTFEAERDDGRRVALREIECEGAAAADRVASDPALQRLCAILAGLSHESLAGTLEVFAVGKRVYVAEEFVDSPRLCDVLRQSGPLQLEEAWAIICQALAGLEFGHQRGLLHLDLRTSNLHYDREQRRVTLTDFGHMQLLLELRPRQSLAAIADAYHAPEVRAGRPPTPASEVYSVAAILHELLTGRLPQRKQEGCASGRFEFLEVDDGGAPRAADRLGELAKRWPGGIFVLRRALAEEPEERYQRAAHLLSALAHAHRADVRREPYLEGERRATVTPRATPVREQSQAPVKVKGGIRFCEACGRPMAPEGEVCVSCGAMATGEETRPAEPDTERSYFQRHAGRLMQEGRYSDAEKALRMAVRRSPRDPLAQRELGDVLTINRRFADAEAAYREVLRLKPDDLQARYELGRVLLNQNKGAEALTELQRLLDRKPARPMLLATLTQMGAAWSSVGRQDAARNYWSRVLEAEPENARVHMALGMSYATEGDVSRAQRHLLRALEIDPDYGEAAAALARVRAQVPPQPVGMTTQGGVGPLGGGAALMTEALSGLGALLGREQWGGHASRSTWQWSRDGGWTHSEETFDTSGGRRVPIEEAEPPDEDEK